MWGNKLCVWSDSVGSDSQLISLVIVVVDNKKSVRFIINWLSDDKRERSTTGRKFCI